MKADAYAKLVILEALIDAEIGHYLDTAGGGGPLPGGDRRA